MLQSLPEKGIRCVYFICAKGEIIYVGQTLNIRRRVSQHSDKRPERIYYMPCQGYSYEPEKRMIKACRPRLNNDKSESLTQSIIGVKDLEAWHLPYVRVGQKGKLVGIIGVGNPTWEVAQCQPLTSNTR